MSSEVGVLDTHAIIWWTLDPGRLSDRARSLCEEMDHRGGLASSMSIWEIGILVKRGRLELPVPFEEYVGRLRALDWLEFVSVDTEIWLTNLALEWEHRDPADRTIVATATVHGLPLVTADVEMRRFYSQAVW